MVAGVQDGVWPDLRLRDSLLGSQALVELLAGRAQDAHGVGSQARAQVLADELRAFVVATSRATRRLVVTAVQDAEEAPSVFCDLVVPPSAPEGPRGTDGSGGPDGADGPGGRGGPQDGPVEPAERRHVRVGAPLDLRGLVAAARGVLVETAAREAGGAGAPGRTSARSRRRRSWRTSGRSASRRPAGDVVRRRGVSSTAPLRGAEETVTVSPSKVETVSTCPLRWSLEAAGGTAPDATHQSLGTLVHSIAESHPSGSLAELRAELDRRWAELALPDGWPARQLRRRAERMVEKLAAYVAQAGEPLLVEPSFDVTVGRARLRGTIDRVEAAGTARSASSTSRPVGAPRRRRRARSTPARGLPARGRGGCARRAGGHAQRGAQLVYVGSTHVGPAVVAQPALEPEPDGSSWARDLVDEAAGTMSAATFTARQNGLCEMCPVRRACPVQPRAGGWWREQRAVRAPGGGRERVDGAPGRGRRAPGRERGRGGDEHRAAEPPRPTLSATRIADLLGRPRPTPEQVEVIEAPLEPTLVVAGAGSGKTETMAARVVWLIANELVPGRGAGPHVHAQGGGRARGARPGAARPARARRGGAASALSLLDRPTVATYNAYAASLVGDHGLRVGVEPGPACSVRRSSGSSRRRSWSPGTTTWAPTAP